jgi:heme/copper-type cytochrome/quinol oxidase subunit 3
MMYDPDLTVVLIAAGIVMSAAVYVWSKDPDRRARAWSLLKLLLGR